MQSQRPLGRNALELGATGGAKRRSTLGKASIWAVFWLFPKKHEPASAAMALCPWWWVMARSVQHSSFLCKAQYQVEVIK